MSPCDTYISGGSKDKVQEVFKKQCEIFSDHGPDFLIAEVSSRKVWCALCCAVLSYVVLLYFVLFCVVFCFVLFCVVC